MAAIVMTDAQRENARSVAKMVAGKLPNGPTAGDFHRAYMGSNEDVLLAVHLVLNDYEDGRAHSAAIA